MGTVNVARSGHSVKTTIRRIAEHYGRTVHTENGLTGFRSTCPAHASGNPKTLHVYVADGHIVGKCWGGCEWRDVASAIERDTGIERLNPPDRYAATYYRDGEPVHVWRKDHADGSKSFPTRGTRDGVPLLLHSEVDTDPIIICEGEIKALAVVRAGFQAASYMGGSGAAGKADYSPVKGRAVAVWPDNDTPGLKAAREAADMAIKAGAASVKIIAPYGDAESGADAADVPDDLRYDFIVERLAVAQEEENVTTPPRRLVSFSVRDYLAMADETAVWQMPYLAPAGCVSLLVGSPFAGKSTLFWSLLSEGLQHGTMLGDRIVPGFTAEAMIEERPTTFKRSIVNVKLDAQLILGQTQPPWTVTPKDYQQTREWTEIIDLLGEKWLRDGPPDILFVDTLGAWAAVADINSYSDTLRAMEPLKDLSAAFQHVAIVATHHNRKGGGNAVDSPLGSRGLTGAADNSIIFDAPDEADPMMRRLRYNGRVMPDDLAMGEKWIRWDDTSGLYSPGRKGAAHEQLIRELLGDADGPLTTGEIIGGVDWPGDAPSDATIRRVLRRMADADILRSEGSTKGGKRWWLGHDAANVC